jgi:hypothetical protein
MDLIDSGNGVALSYIGPQVHLPIQKEQGETEGTKKK